MSSEPPAKRQNTDASDLHELRAAERRMQRDMGAMRRKEAAMVLRIALKEREGAEYREQIREQREALRPSHTQTTTLLLDPAVNAEIMRLREKVKEAQRKEKEAQDQLQASQFQSGSIAGKKLMQKCKELQVRGLAILTAADRRACARRQPRRSYHPTRACTQAENDQLGKDLSEGRVQKLRAEVALQKEYSSELKKALGETREWVEHLSEELDTSQALVLSLRRELNALKSARNAE